MNTTTKSTQLPALYKEILKFYGYDENLRRKSFLERIKEAESNK